VKGYPAAPRIDQAFWRWVSGGPAPRSPRLEVTSAGLARPVPGEAAPCPDYSSIASRSRKRFHNTYDTTPSIANAALGGATLDPGPNLDAGYRACGRKARAEREWGEK
jgi:hypothetical protein